MKSTAIERVAVIGAGLMGHGIALELAVHGYSVMLHDANPERLQRSSVAIREGLARMSEAGFGTAQGIASAPDRITAEIDLRAAVSPADLVIEAVTEDLQVKHQAFRHIDTAAPHHAILASNSSSFMPSLLAAATKRPDRVLVAHYFNPPYLLPLVELVRGELTSDETIEAMRSLYLGIGKNPVVVQREAPGFVGNRLQMALLREALAIVEAGIASPQDVDTIIRTSFGRRLAVAGIFEVFDAAGWDVTLAVAEQLFPAIDRSPEPPPSLRDRVARGKLGLKSGAGFYEWTPDAAEELRRRIGLGLTAIARLEKDRSLIRGGGRPSRRTERMALDEAAKKKVLRDFTYGLYAVTAAHDGERGVFTANWLSQASFDPPLVMLSVENESSTLPLIRASGRFAICPLDAAQKSLAGDLGRPKARAGDKYAKLDLRVIDTESGVPALADSLGYVVCDVRSEAPAGDSVVFVAEVIEARSFSDAPPLEMRAAGFRHAG